MIATIAAATAGCATILGLPDQLTFAEQDGGGESSGDGAGEAGDADGGTDAADGGNSPCDDGSVCADPAPDGWSGPVAMWTGGGAPPTCEGNWAGASLDLYDGLDAQAPVCTCACNPAAGQTCPPLEMHYFGQTNCNGAFTVADLAPGCASVPGYAALEAYLRAPEGGSCATDAGKDIPTAAWSTGMRLCGYSGNVAPGCPSPLGCVARPQAPFGAVCVYSSASKPCPPAYPNRTVLYQSHTDTRDCSSCSCGAVDGGVCTGGSGNAYPDTSCTSSNGPFGPGACVVPGVAINGVYGATSPSIGAPGTCAPSGGLPTGSAAATQPVTVCCKP